MKKLFVFILLVLSLTAFAQQKKVAVYVTGEDAGINKVLGSKLVSAIARSNEFTAIERTESFLAELSKEQNYQRTGAVDDSELSRLGKQFGVQYICVASVLDAFNEKYLSARLIDVETAQVERTASSSGAIQSLDGIVAAANTISTDLLSSLGNGKQPNTKKVAVYVVKNEAGKSIGRVLGDKLVAGFTNSGRYIAIERTNSFLAQLNKEQKYQHSGAVDDSDLSRLGKQFGVQYVCVADVSDVYGEKYIFARLIDVETAEVVNTHDVGGEMNNMGSCLRMANEIATSLSKGTLAEQAEEARLKAEKEAQLKAEEEARIQAEREAAEKRKMEKRELALQKEKERKERTEKRKAELNQMLEREYIIATNIQGDNYMIYLNPVDDVSYEEYIANGLYSRCGYNDWKIANSYEFAILINNLPMRGEGIEYDWDRNNKLLGCILGEIFHFFDRAVLLKGKKMFWCGSQTVEEWYGGWVEDLPFLYADGTKGKFRSLERGAIKFPSDFYFGVAEWKKKMRASVLLIRKIE